MDLQGGRTPLDRFGHSGPSCGIFKDSTALLVRANPNQTRRDHLELHDCEIFYTRPRLEKSPLEEGTHTNPNPNPKTFAVHLRSIWIIGRLRRGWGGGGRWRSIAINGGSMAGGRWHVDLEEESTASHVCQHFFK